MHNVVYEWGKAVGTFPPLLLPDGVLVVWVCDRWLVTPADFSLWSLETWQDCCLAVLHGVPSESWGKKWPQVFLNKFHMQMNKCKSYNTERWCGCMCLAVGLTASLELEDVEEGDSGDEEGEERSEGDGEEELEEVLLCGADGRTTTTSSPSGTLLLHSSSCWDSNSVTSFPTEAGEGHMRTRSDEL